MSEKLILNGHAAEIHTCTFDPGGEYILTASQDSTARIWDAEKGTLLSILEHPWPVQSAAYSPDGKFIVTGGNDSFVRIWEVATHKVVQMFKHFERTMYSCTVFSSNGQHILAAGDSYDVGGVTPNSYRAAYIWNVTNGVLEHSIDQGHSFYDLNYSPDNSKIISTNRYTPVKVWDVATEQVVLTLAENNLNYYFYAAKYFSDGKRIVTSVAQNNIVIWDSSSGDELDSWTGHTDVITNFAFSTNGKYLISTSDDKTLCVWDTESGTKLQTFSGHQAAVNAAAFSPSNDLIVSASVDNTIRIWDWPM